MGGQKKIKDKEEINEQSPQDEQTGILDKNTMGADTIVAEKEEEKPVQISSKQFVKKLREEFKKEKIKESIYTAFLASVPRVDWEENYRLIWETTFKRPPAKK